MNDDLIQPLIQRPVKKNTGFFVHLLLVALSILVTIPLFIIIYRYVPNIKIPFKQGIRIDHYLTFSLIFLFNYLIIKIFRNITIGLLIAVIIVLLTNEVRNEGRYGITDIVKDYQSLIFFIKKQPIHIPFLKEYKMTIRDAPEIIDAIDYNNSKLRSFAIENATKYFTDKHLYYRYKNTIRYFSLFKSIKENWQYIPDPQNEEYYAKASETAELLAGDCDDYAIFIAACIKAIGGEVRLIRTPNHLYPEVKICVEKNFDPVHYLIKEILFENESRNKSVYYHKDDGYIWLNFDYTADYPGGAFLSEEINGILII
ncbi:hypothetical protein ACFL6I_14720 [candidate division KSB1 bacterium]